MTPVQEEVLLVEVLGGTTGGGSTGDDSCEYSNDGACDGDHPNFDQYDVCVGTDSTDCDGSGGSSSGGTTGGGSSECCYTVSMYCGDDGWGLLG